MKNIVNDKDGKINDYYKLNNINKINDIIYNKLDREYKDYIIYEHDEIVIRENDKNIVNKCEREPMYSTSPDDCNRTDAPVPLPQHIKS